MIIIEGIRIVAKKQKYSIIQSIINPNPEYKRLKAHLNAQPVGFPSTVTGVENRLLTEIFTPSEAEIALYLETEFLPFESIFERASKDGISREMLWGRLNGMEKKGCIFMRYRDGEPFFALHPFIIGMFEMQIYRLTPGYFLDTRSYAMQRFGIEYLTTKVPQMRVIPIQKSITPELETASFDEIKTLVEDAPEPLRLIPCICKTGKDLLDDPCKKTDRREICLLFRDFAEMFERHGMGRAVSKAEALEMLSQSEEEGLMLMPSNMREPQVICSCCGCCCGITGMLSMVKRPVEFTATNYVAELNREVCNGCGKCVRRCNMKAMVLDGETRKPVRVNPARCIGCGVCVPACKTGAIALIKRETATVPPRDHDALYAEIASGKKGTIAKTVRMIRAMTGPKVL